MIEEIKRVSNTTSSQNFFFNDIGFSTEMDNTNEQNVFFWNLEKKKTRDFTEREIEYFEAIVLRYETFLEFMKKNKEQ